MNVFVLFVVCNGDENKTHNAFVREYVRITIEKKRESDAYIICHK